MSRTPEPRAEIATVNDRLAPTDSKSAQAIMRHSIDIG
jgi:hypothetical protein